MTGADMGACKTRAAAEQCAEIEDLLGIIGSEANEFRVVNTGSVELIIHNLRREIGERSH